MYIYSYFNLYFAQKMDEKALKYSYVNRKQKKRVFRKVWITRINAASRMEGVKYSRLINKLNIAKINLNRKMLAQIAVLDSSTFSKILEINDANVKLIFLLMNLEIS